MMKRLFPALGMVAGLLAFPGCGSSDLVTVNGRLLKGGASYKPPEGHQVSVTFVGMEIQDPAGNVHKRPEPFLADYDDDAATFSVPGRDGQGIPRGTYRIAVTQRMTREAFDAAKPKAKPGQLLPINRETDFLDGKFSQEASPIVREIKDSTEMVIDLDKPSEK